MSNETGEEYPHLELSKRLTVLSDQQIADLRACVRNTLFSVPFGDGKKDEDTSSHP